MKMRDITGGAERERVQRLCVRVRACAHACMCWGARGSGKKPVWRHCLLRIWMKLAWQEPGVFLEELKNRIRHINSNLVMSYEYRV